MAIGHWPWPIAHKYWIRLVRWRCYRLWSLRCVNICSWWSAFKDGPLPFPGVAAVWVNAEKTLITALRCQNDDHLSRLFAILSAPCACLSVPPCCNNVANLMNMSSSQRSTFSALWASDKSAGGLECWETLANGSSSEVASQISSSCRWSVSLYMNTKWIHSAVFCIHIMKEFPYLSIRRWVPVEVRQK